MITQNRRAALRREFEESGLSMAAFCRRRNLGYSTLMSWRRAERDEGAVRDAAPRFVEIEAVMTEPVGPAAGQVLASEDHRRLVRRQGRCWRNWRCRAERCCESFKEPIWPVLLCGEEFHDLHAGTQSVSGGAAADLRQGFEELALMVQLGSDDRGEPMAEIAERLNMSAGALRVALCRLPQRFRELLFVEVGETIPSTDREAEMVELPEFL